MKSLGRERVRHVARAIWRRKPELFLALLGIAIRISMLWRFDVKAGYDASAHWVYVEWFRTHIVRIPLNLTKEAYHPPLYYFVAGMFDRLVENERWLSVPSLFFACLTIPLFWWGLERHLPRQRAAHAVALALYAVIPAGVHLSAMMTAEGMNGFLALSALLMAAELLRDRSGFGLALSVALGVTLGLELLAKVSALVIIGSIGIVVGLKILIPPGSPKERTRRVLPWILCFATATATSGWYFERNYELHHKPFLMGFDGTDGLPPPSVERTPYLKRRPPEFFYGWTNDIYRFPFFPSGITPHSYFWPVLITSTFSDYYNYAYVRPVYARDPDAVDVNTRLIPRRSFKYAAMSVFGGTLIALTTAIAWIMATWTLLKRGDWSRLVFCVAPFVALLGQVHFAVRYPIDGQGPIKGVYLQFACIGLPALYGIAVSALLKARRLRILGALELAALALVAVYSVYARVTW